MSLDEDCRSDATKLNDQLTVNFNLFLAQNWPTRTKTLPANLYTTTIHSYLITGRNNAGRRHCNVQNI